MHFWMVVWHVMLKATACKRGHTLPSIVATWHHLRWRRNKERQKNFIKGRLTTWNTFWKWISSIQMALMWIKVGIPVKCSWPQWDHASCIMNGPDSVWCIFFDVIRFGLGIWVTAVRQYQGPFTQKKNARRGQWNEEISISIYFFKVALLLTL